MTGGTRVAADASPEPAAATAEQEPNSAVLAQLDARLEGLSSEEAAARLARVGPNSLPERHVSALRRLLGYFWGPIPWMIEIAAILSAVVRHWEDLVVITVLLAFNAVVGFVQEYQASNAVDALKHELALRARALRDGSWADVDARDLVPGDIVRVRLGDVIPADVRLLEGEYLSVDQAALTGESLPVDKRSGDTAYSGSIAKQGEMVGVVVSTGKSTFFGRTASLVAGARSVSHFQRAVLQIGDYLIFMALVLAGSMIVVQLLRGASFVSLVQFALILTVAAIPVAMPAVLSVTMAVGSVALSKMRAIVSRLESIEEMAGIDVLCSDKTGTLTKNELTLGDPVTFEGASSTELLSTAALACKAEDQDPIDLAVLAAAAAASLPDHRYVQRSFTPFDPVRKRSDAVVDVVGEQSFTATKGAPQVVLELTEPDAGLRTKVMQQIDALAARGYRTLGVARTGSGSARFLGLLPLFDPPREDSAETIARAREHGIEVKLITGDDVAIARETASQLGLGTDVVAADQVLGTDATAGNGGPRDLAALAERADGFARVFPEHKYEIVRALQGRGHLVGMTGDGVNDAPALKQADVGTAVFGATDAARAAADLVLTAPGLSVIVAAVEQARMIFERMNSYAIFRITETIRVMVFVVAAMIAFNFYPISAILIILIALFNDVPIMTIAYDHTRLDPSPVRWDMRRVLSVATVLGVVGVIETFGLLVLAREWLQLDPAQIQTLIFLKLTIAGHLTLFVARTREPFYKPPYPAPAVLWSAIGTKLLATVLVALGFGLVTTIGWGTIGLVWGYCLAWIFIEDRFKLQVYKHLDLRAARHSRFLELVGQPLHPAGS